MIGIGKKEGTVRQGRGCLGSPFLKGAGYENKK